MTRSVLQRRVRRLIETVHRIIGAPDYGGYLRFMRANHPECRVMSRREFEREYLDRRYRQQGNRCC
jgi:uncharacterized short protein YbdD (DUF466 family)